MILIFDGLAQVCHVLFLSRAGVLFRFHVLPLSAHLSFAFLNSFKLSVHILKSLTLIICSKSRVERVFSTVRNIFSDKCISFSHSTLDETLIVYGNHSLWSKDEREEMVESS